MLARFPLKKMAMVGTLLVLPAVLFWLVTEEALSITIFAVISLVSLVLACLNLWDNQRLNLKMALDDVEAAREFMEKSQYRAALNRLESAVQHDPGCFEVRVARGEIYRCEQSYEHARRELVEALQIRPDSYSAHFALGLTYLQEKKVFEAISEFWRTIQLKPGFSEAHFILAQSYELAGEKGKALDAYRAFLKVARNDDVASRKISEYVERSQARILALK